VASRGCCVSLPCVVLVGIFVLTGSSGKALTQEHDDDKDPIIVDVLFAVVVCLYPTRGNGVHVCITRRD